LLSAESLRKTGYFDPAAVRSWRQAFTGVRLRRVQRMSVEMGLAGVLTTQLWHHTFIDGSLADPPSPAPPRRPGAAARATGQCAPCVFTASRRRVAPPAAAGGNISARGRRSTRRPPSRTAAG